ncbi:MAG: tetratricopeptide repeat protein, partial [Thermoplasmata archaeon]
IADRLESKELIIRATLGIGHILAEKGELENAIERYTRCLYASITIDDLDNQAVAHNSLGIVFDKSGDRREAVEHYLKAIECAKARGNVRMVGIGSLNAGELLAKEKRFKEAEERLNDAMVIFKRIDEKFLIAGVHVARGIMYKLKSEKKNCIEEFEKGISLLESVGAPYYLGYSYYEYGLACKDFGDHANAKKHLEKSREIFKNINARDDLENVEKELCMI